MEKEKEFNRKEWWLSHFEETTKMTFDQFKEKYFTHYANFKKLSHAYNFISCHMYDFFTDKDPDEAFIDMIKSLQYLEEAISVEKQAFSYIYTTLWGKWDTDDAQLDNEIEAYYELSFAYNNTAKTLQEKIGTVRCGLIELYMRKKNYNMEDCYNSFYKTLDFSQYTFSIPKILKNRFRYIHGNLDNKE